MSSSSGKVSVRWWNHRNAIHKAVRELQHQEMFADIILVCEGKKIEAHKFVLSACSDYFYKELQEMPYRGLFYLPAEINEKHLPSLLDYIYSGEAIVDEKEVNDLLKAAETLSIRGLAIPFSDQEEEDEESEEENHKNTVRKLMMKQKGNSSKRLKINKNKGTSDELTFNEMTDENSGSTRELRNNSKSNMDVNKMLSVVLNGEQNTSKSGNERILNTREERIEDPNLKCPHCQRQFHWRSNLTKHIRIHTGEKPYTCPSCDYKTGYSEALKRHIRTHTGERPYECNLCDYKCKDNSSLKLHMNKHTGSSSFPCRLCPYKTRIRTAFEKHMLMYHESSRPDMAYQESASKHDLPHREEEKTDNSSLENKDVSYMKAEGSYRDPEQDLVYRSPNKQIEKYNETNATDVHYEAKQSEPFSEASANVSYPEASHDVPTYHEQQEVQFHDPRASVPYHETRPNVQYHEPPHSLPYDTRRPGLPTYPGARHEGIKIEDDTIQQNVALTSLAYDDIHL